MLAVALAAMVLIAQARCGGMSGGCFATTTITTPSSKRQAVNHAPHSHRLLCLPPLPPPAAAAGVALQVSLMAENGDTREDLTLPKGTEEAEKLAAQIKEQFAAGQELVVSVLKVNLCAAAAAAAAWSCSWE